MHIYNKICVLLSPSSRRTLSCAQNYYIFLITDLKLYYTWVYNFIYNHLGKKKLYVVQRKA